MATQILKLGLAGSEITLPTESRINDGGQDTFKYNSGESANGSLKVDVIATKRNFSITWGVMSEADYMTTLNTIYQQQLAGNFLNYIYTNQSGAETHVTVFMQPPSRGSLVQRDVYYDNAVNITMQEV